MGTDRVLYWQGGRVPTRAQVRKVCENYIGAGGTVEWKRDRFYLTLAGNVSRALDGIEGVSETMQKVYDEEKAEPFERWIEVYADHEYLDIITRHADEFTRALAEGLHKVFHLFWQPSIHPEGLTIPVVPTKF